MHRDTATSTSLPFCVCSGTQEESKEDEEKTTSSPHEEAVLPELARPRAPSAPGDIQSSHSPQRLSRLLLAADSYLPPLAKAVDRLVLV